jgi:septal ring factor EnvC (AmiA/AmiB activator)
MALSAHHASARKIVLTVDRLLDELESGRDVSMAMQSQISQHLNTLARELEALERLLPEQTADRSLWRKKINQLHEQSNSQRAALGKFMSKQQQHVREMEEREALLQVRGRTRSSQRSHSAELPVGSRRGP